MPSLVGTWEREYYDSHDGEYCLQRFTFNANGTGNYLELWEKDGSGEYIYVEENEDFTYKFDKNSMTLQVVYVEDGEEIAMKNESITDNLLIISNVYTDEHKQGKLSEKEVFKKK